MLKRIIILLFLAVITAMGAATLLERYHGTAYIVSHIYGAWWFTALWALLTATSIAWIIRRRMRRASLITLHSALVIILTGALLTHLFSVSGIIHLREGLSTNSILTQGENGPSIRQIPFTITLDTFQIAYHEGTASAADNISSLTITHRDDTLKANVSMNSIFSAQGVRLCQSSYDEDGHGSYLTVNIDPWGIAVTYIGYAMLFVALLWMLADPKGTFHRLLHHPLLKKSAPALLAILFTAIPAQGANTLTREQAEAFGRLFIDYNGRICQVQTYALDFCKKLSGKRHYGSYSAEQVLTGFIFYGDEWCNEPVIRVKSSAIRDKLGLASHVSFNDLFRDQSYILGPLLIEYQQGNGDKLHKDIMELDDRLQLILSLRRGITLKLFPFRSPSLPSSLTWYAPSSSFPQDMEPQRSQYIKDIFGIINNDVRAGHDMRVMDALHKLGKYQATYGETSLPTPLRTAAERIYNAIPFATILFMFNLTMAILSLFANRLSRWAMMLSALALTVCIILRWIISGTVPMTNGYETMLIIAWFTQWIAVIMARRIPIMTTFGLLISGFALLVSHIGQMNPAITHVMPVLNSPLLSIHVSVIMLAYALLSITFACGVAALLMPRRAEYLQVLSLLFLHPSLTALGIGIFTGAIWANVSWGTYWSWDPKEVWALITLMVYAVAVHSQSLPSLRRPRTYHIYMVLAFLTLLMTYFGVNYFLGGMHSYA